MALMALLVVDGLERREETVEVAQLGAGLAVGQPHRLRTAVPAPEALARGSKLLLQKFAAAIGRGAVTLQRQIELQDLRAEGMRFGLLLRIDAIAGPDEQPQHQRKQQAHQSLNRGDRAFRVGEMLGWERMLQQDAEQAAGENDAHDQRRPPDKSHRLPHSASIAPPGRAGRRVAYALSPRQPAFSCQQDRPGCRAFTRVYAPRGYARQCTELRGVRFCARLNLFKLLGSFFCNQTRRARRYTIIAFESVILTIWAPI